MASVGGADAERNSLDAADRSLGFPLGDEHQLFHYQPSPSSSSGGNFKPGGGDEFQFEQFTEPLYDDSVIGDAIETQVVDLIEETEVFEIDGETQLLDDPSFHVNIGTQVLDFEDEVVLDSESERTDVTEVVSDTDGFSDDETGQGFQSLRNEKIQQTTTICENNQGSKEQSFSSGCQQRSSESSRNFASIRTAALRASALASRNINIKDTKGDSTPILTGAQVSHKSAIRSNEGKSEPSMVADQNHDFRTCDGNLRPINYANNGLIRSEAARKLFDNESSAEKGVPCVIDNEDAREREYEVSSGIPCIGLSYVESQEPGELSQANALNFVERLLNENLLEGELEIDHRKSAESKPRPPSGAKGTLNFAKISANKYAFGETRIFDWVDGHEDEGGGDFFVRKKEELFCGVQSRKSSTELRNPKGRAQDKTRSTHEVSDTDFKRMVNSDSKLMLHNPKDGIRMQEAGMSYKRNLSREFDEYCKVNFSTIAKRNAPEKLDVGLDTQLAAEAMEDLLNGEGVEIQEANKVEENVRTNFKGSFGVRTRSKTRSEQCISVKRRRGSEDCTPPTLRRTNKRYRKEPLVVPHNHSKNDKDCGTKLQKQEKRAKSNASKYSNNIGGRIEPNKVAITSVSERNNDVAPQRNCPNESKSGRPRRSLRCSLRKEEMLVEVNPSMPIARRTRLSMLTNLVTPDSRLGANHALVVDSIDQQSNDNSLRHKELSSFVLNDTREVRNVKSGQKDRADLALIVRDFNRGARSCARKRRSCYLSLDGISKFKPSNLPEDNEQPTYRLRSGGSVRSFNVNSSTRKIRSSGHSSTLLASADANSEGKTLLRDVEIERQVVVALPCDSAVPSGNICNNLVSTKALKYTGRSQKLSSFSNRSVMQSANCDSHRTPKKKSRPSLSSSAPVDRVTPTESSSPVCKGDEYLKQSCKGSFAMELQRLNSMDQEPVTPLKDASCSRDLTQIRILFSQHLDEDITKHQRKILARLCISEVSSILDATHFIADKFVRTRNMLEAIASGKPIMTHLWLSKIGQVNTPIDEEAYILRDIKKEKAFGFCMPVSLAQARKCSLLQGRKVFITPNTKPGKDVISSLAKAVQGQVVERLGRSALSNFKVSDDLLVLSCEDDYGICIPFLEKGASVYSSELLLNGIVTQKLDFERYCLFSEHVKRTRSSVWLKKNDKFHPVPSGKHRS